MNMNSYMCCAPKTGENQNIISQLETLKLIADESRLKMLCILRSGEHCVNELIGHVNLSQSLVSHHLADLRQQGIVTDDKRGREVFYRLTPYGQTIMVLLAQLNKEVL